jgi:IS605 OrfB family transposase
MLRVQKNHIRRQTKQTYGILKTLTHHAKNLYNRALWLMNHHFKEHNAYLTYLDLYAHIKQEDCYKQLPAQTAQQVLKYLERSFKAYFALLRLQAKGQYDPPVQPPKYLPKDGHFPCVFPKDQFKVFKNGVRLALWRFCTQNRKRRYFCAPLPKTVQNRRIKEIRLIPRYDGRYFELEFVYAVDPEPAPVKATRYLAIDLGTNIFAACVSTTGPAFLVEGRGLKSYNRWWNKEKGRLQGQYARQGIRFGPKLQNHLQKRRNVLNNFMAQAVQHIIQECVEQQIGHVIVGDLKKIKQKMNMGRRSNQNFHYLPFDTFREKLQAKCEVHGIDYHEIHETYTSQTCSHCGLQRKANRIHRGLYVCKKCKTVLHADINGAINIYHHVAPESSPIGSSGRVNRPVRCRIVAFAKPSQKRDAPKRETASCKQETPSFRAG